MDTNPGSVYESYERTHQSYDLTRLPIGIEEIFTRLSLRGTSGGLRILDAGCGTGLYLQELTRANPSLLFGLDTSQEGIRQSAIKVATASNVKLAVGDIRAIPLPERSIDVALYNFVLHHLPQPENNSGWEPLATTLAEAYRVLDHSGELIIGTCDQQQLSPDTGCCWYYRYFPQAAKALAARFIPIDSLQNLLRQIGFTQVSIMRPSRNCYTSQSFDPQGPFRAQWRAGDSLFAYYHDKPDQLSGDLARLQAAIDDGSLLTQIAETRQRTESIGQAIFVIATKP